MPNSKPSPTSDLGERPDQAFKYRWLARYAAALAAVGAGLLLRLGLTAWLGPGLPTYITFYPPVMAVALLAGFGPGLVATLTAALAADYWLLPPISRFEIANPVDAVGLALFSGMGVFISVVAELYRRARLKAAAYDKELALRQSEERYRSLVELSPEGVFINRNDRIVLVNPAALQLFGASSAEQLLGKSPFELFHPDFHAVMRERIGKVLAGQRAPVLEEKIIRLDGVAVDVEVVGAPVLDHGERAVQVLLRDITERKRAEEALRQAAEDLQRSNRDLEQFAYVASHDLQEPLRAVGGYVKLLQLRFPEMLDARAQDYIAGACEGATRMERLVTDLLDYSRVGTRGGAFLPADLDAVLNQALCNLQAGIESAHATITHDPLPTLSVDATRIMQLFQNLIGNALKFHDEQPPKIHIGSQKQAGRWVFSVRDNGIGIEPQYFERIFQIFQRLHTRKDYSGTGIGLAICKRIVKRHGGTIWVESRPGQGSTFFFAIPESLGKRQTVA